MNLKILLAGIALLMNATSGHAQTPRSVRVVAVIEPIYGDSAGRAIVRGRPLNSPALDSLLMQLQHTIGATIWFSWSGTPTRVRTAAQDRLLAQLRASGVRVELRTDSTRYARVILS